MTVLAELRQETYLPEVDAKDLASVHEFLTAFDKTSSVETPPRCLLIDSGAGERVELPFEFYRVLRQVVEAMRRGLAVTVVPRSQTLTTQQAAELLGVSRPTVVRLLDSSQLPFERVGTHRRLRLSDVLAYREKRREAQYRMLAATSIDIDEEEDVETVLASVRAARRSVAQGGGSR